MLLFQIIYDLATAVMGERLPFAAWSNLRASTAGSRLATIEAERELVKIIVNDHSCADSRICDWPSGLVNCCG